MMQRRTFRRLLAGAVAAGTIGLLFGPGTPRADAACISAEVYATKEGGGRIYALGPKKCVAPTPWNETFYFHSEEGVNGVVPRTWPNGYGYGLWITAP